MAQSLQDLWVVVTRPAAQAAGLSAAIEKRGGHAISWPALSIEPIKISAQSEKKLTELDSYDHIIFISVNAVNYGLAAIKKHRPDLSLGTLEDKNIFAVGKTTASALQAKGIETIHVPEIASSEGLLRMPVFDRDVIYGKRCLIFRGVGGNEKLAEGLLKRGATVDYTEVYQRKSAYSDPTILEIHREKEQLNVIIITSIAGLENLFDIMGKKHHAWLFSTPLLTVSDRVTEFAQRMGFTNQLLIAKSARDNDIIAALESWHQS
ncbi:MAG: uroporphyrinogen-III synthase [Gammaproteobacteria bacterium]